MAYNGSGVWVRLYSWTNDAANGIKIRADRMDAETNDMCNNGLSAVMTRDGQGSPSANIPWNGYNITGVGALGIGMVPTNIVDITQNQNAGSQARILNNSAGAAANASFVSSNGTQIGQVGVLGTGYTTNGILAAGRMYLSSTSGLAFNSGGAVLFGVNSSAAEVARIGTDGSFLVGTTTNAGAGNISLAGSIFGSGNLSVNGFVNGVSLTSSTVNPASGGANVDIGPITNWSGYLIYLNWDSGDGFALLNTDSSGNVTVISSSQSRGGQASFDTTNNQTSNSGNGIAWVSSGGEAFIQAKINWPGGPVRVTKLT